MIEPLSILLSAYFPENGISQSHFVQLMTYHVGYCSNEAIAFFDFIKTLTQSDSSWIELGDIDALYDSVAHMAGTGEFLVSPCFSVVIGENEDSYSGSQVSLHEMMNVYP